MDVLGASNLREPQGCPQVVSDGYRVDRLAAILKLEDCLVDHLMCGQRMVAGADLLGHVGESIP